MTKVMLVTGASRGIGAATARCAAANGYAVAVNYNRSPEEASQVVSSIKENGGIAIPVKADVSSKEEVTHMFSEIDEQLGTIAALVNNAGILEHQSRVEEISSERLLRIFSVNVFGAFFCAQEAIKRMATNRGGKGGAIVNVSSVAARLGAGGEYVDYAASKGALDSFTIGLANEVAQQGIRVNAVRPGYIDTKIHAAGGEPNRIKRLENSIPLRRGGSPEEVAKAILWLLSSEASYTTGSFIEVSGGR